MGGMDPTAVEFVGGPEDGCRKVVDGLPPYIRFPSRARSWRTANQALISAEVLYGIAQYDRTDEVRDGRRLYRFAGEA